MAKIMQKSTVPFYAAAAVWALYALLFPLYRFSHFLIVGGASLLAFFVMRAVCPDIEVEVSEKPEPPKSTGNEDLDKMLKDGDLAIAEMKRLNDAIADEKISADIDRLEFVSGKIFDAVRENPANLPQIRRFMDYYLPTTLKLLNAYDRMGAQGVSGENIDATMTRVRDMMDTIIKAFERQLDALFGAQALDISTDITVLETMMAREGLTEQPLRAQGDADTDGGDITLTL